LPYLFPLTILDPSVAEHATDAGLDEIAVELTEITTMDDDDGINYYNDNIEKIGKCPHRFGTEQSLILSVAWWKADIKKKNGISMASRLLEHVGLIGN